MNILSTFRELGYRRLFKHREKTEALIEKGIFLMEKGDYTRAAHVLQKAAKRSPKNIDVLAPLGLVFEHLQEAQKARQCYLQALTVNPAAGKIHKGLARLNLRGPHYLEALARIHVHVQPAAYVEIGIRDGASFCLADPDIFAVGIDPNPLIDIAALPERHSIIADTSDNYFQGGRLSSDLGGQSVDLAFIDGMHLFEFALRDFIALEKSTHPAATIMIHDCYPLNELTARRKQETSFWSGDVWKLILCLKEYRQDLKIVTLPCPPTGLAVITGLDPLSDVLRDHLGEIYEKYVPMDFSAIEQGREQKLNLAEPSEAVELRSLIG